MNVQEVVSLLMQLKDSSGELGSCTVIYWPKCLNGYLREAEKRALEYLAKAYEELCQYVDHLLLHPEESVLPAQQAQVHLTGGVGRPAFGISCHQLQGLIEPP